MPTRKVESPFKEYPGHMILPTMLDADDFNTWWIRVNEIEEDETIEDFRNDLFLMWQARFHIIKEFTLKLGKDENGKPYEFEKTGLMLPSPLIAVWFIEETKELLAQASNLKNYLGLSDDD